MRSSSPYPVRAAAAWLLAAAAALPALASAASSVYHFRGGFGSFELADDPCFVFSFSDFYISESAAKGRAASGDVGATVFASGENVCTGAQFSFDGFADGGVSFAQGPGDRWLVAAGRIPIHTVLLDAEGNVRATRSESLHFNLRWTTQRALMTRSYGSRHDVGPGYRSTSNYDIRSYPASAVTGTLAGSIGGTAFSATRFANGQLGFARNVDIELSR